MAASSEGGAAKTTRSPPDQLASFYKLLEKRAMAAQLGRYARNAELSAQAAVQAEALFGCDDSLVVASLRCNESESVNTLAMVGSAAEKEELMRKSWVALLSVINLVLRRLADNTLLPGTIREEELDYEAYAQAVAN